MQIKDVVHESGGSGAFVVAVGGYLSWWVGDGGGRQRYMDILVTLIVSCTQFGVVLV